MRLALKLALAIWFGIVLVLMINGYTRFLRESQLFESDMARDHGVMGRGIAAAIGTVWEDEGRERALAVVERVNQKESDILIRFVEIGTHPQETLRPTAPPEALNNIQNGTIENWCDRHGEGHLYSYVPIFLKDQMVGAVELSEPLTAEKAYIHTSNMRFIATTGGMALVTGIISVAIGVIIIGRPIRALAERARRIGTGDFSTSALLKQEDELGFLGQEIENMARHLAAARDQVDAESKARSSALEQLRHAERVSTVGKLAAGVAHELGTPLNVIAWRTKKILSGKVEGAEARENGRIANEQCERITKIVRQLLDFARQKPPETRVFDMVDILEQTVALLEPIAGKSKVTFHIHSETRPFQAEADPSQLQQVFTNLFLNGIQAMPTGGEVRVTLSHSENRAPAHIKAGHHWVRIAVSDQGEGISAEHLPHIFDPFFTTKKVGDGTGLGLSVAWGIITEHGGWIDVESRLGMGAQFSIYLPERTK